MSRAKPNKISKVQSKYAKKNKGVDPKHMPGQAGKAARTLFNRGRSIDAAVDAAVNGTPKKKPKKK